VSDKRIDLLCMLITRPNITIWQVGVLVHHCRGKLYWAISSFGLKSLTNIIGVLIYDHIATLPEEIAYIWCRPKALSAMLFLVNRYVALFSNLFGLFSGFLPVSNKVVRCRVCYSTSMLTLYLRVCRGLALVLEYLLFSQQKLSCSKYVLAGQVLLVFQQVFICSEFEVYRKKDMLEFSKI
jgi:hypothetical protein